MDEVFRVLVIYDVPGNRERTQFSKCLLRYGKRVQKSAFEAWLGNYAYNKLLTDIDKFINKPENDVRVYKIYGACQVYEFNSLKSKPIDEVLVI